MNCGKSVVVATVGGRFLVRWCKLLLLLLLLLALENMFEVVWFTFLWLNYKDG